MLDNLDQSMFTARVVEWETESQIKNKLLKERAEREKKKKGKQVQSFTDKFNLLTRRLHNGRIQDLDAFEESGEDEFSYEEESLFFRDDDTYGDTGNEKMVNKF